MDGSLDRQSRALRLGVFVIGGTLLLALAIATVLGGDLLKRQERVLMRFSGTVQGLQVGSAVVFRGVRVGNVVSLDLARDPSGGRPVIDVQADLERAALAALQPAGVAPAESGSLVRPLVQAGLLARLSTQSLLTGQLFVALDLRPPSPAGPASPAAAAAAPTDGAAARGLAVIPTQPSALESAQAQLEDIDLAGLARDLRALAVEARRVVASAPVNPTLDEITRLAADMRRLAARVERRVDPLADSAARTLAAAERTASAAGAAVAPLAGAAERVGGAAERVGGAADRVGALAAPDAAFARAADAVRTAAAELGATAASLRGSVGSESPLPRNLDRAAQDVARAARAVRELAELLEQHPEALLRGRPAAP